MRALLLATTAAIGIGLVGTSPTFAGSTSGDELARAAELGALMDQAQHRRRNGPHGPVIRRPPIIVDIDDDDGPDLPDDDDDDDD
jgi:hypothetical protein